MMDSQENDQLSAEIRAEPDALKRFFLAREYLDASDYQSINKSILLQLLSDADELIRAEVADFLIVSGGLELAEIERHLGSEQSDIVLPRLWLALALADPVGAQIILRETPFDIISPYRRAYHDAAMYVSFGLPRFLYNLCAVACSDDLPASHSAIDLLRVVASDRVTLLRELVADLRRHNADNAEKAETMLADLEKSAQ
ncbi:MAG TPA: hypothetical protein VFZ91_00020 [Allosphingosinicella sp.]